nr:uncharacterized protein LOC104108915 [Nicotiana tomentosiformis]
MWNKYCKKDLSTVVQFSPVWRQMLHAREEVEHEILWEMKSGTTSVWHENWTGLGALYDVLPPEFPIDENLEEEAWDIPHWMPTASGKFSIKIAWNIQRHKVWQHFLGAVGNYVPLIQVKKVIRAWWNIDCCPKLKPLFEAAPTIITWELWKKRNTFRNGVTISTNRVIHEVNNLARIKFPWLSHIHVLWPEMIQFFEAYKPILITRKVTWQFPHEKWYKCNTDGASKGNFRPSSLGFCVRDDACNLIYARSVNLDETTNVVAEAKAILHGLEYCSANNLHPLILETDCLLLKKLIEREWDTPWCIMAEVQKIQELRDHFNVIFQHVYREGNIIADYLANIAFSFVGTTHFHSFAELPTVGRRLINMDKSQIPNLRVKIAKRKFLD